MRCGAIVGLAALRDARGVEKARDAARPEKHNALRASAVPALAKLADAKDAPRKEIAEELVRLVDDWWLRVKIAACGAVADLGEDAALPALARAAVHDLDGRVRRTAAESAKKIREGKDKGDEVRRLRQELEELREDLRKIRDEVRKKTRG